MSDELVPAGGDTGSGAGDSAGGSSPTASVSVPESSETAVPSGGTPGKPGDVPYERFKDINDRYARLRWAEGHNAETVSQQQAFFQWLDTDPVGAFNYMQDYLSRRGVLKAPAPAGEGRDGRPQPSITIPETGQRFYTAEDADQLVTWAVKQAESRFDSRLQPIEQSMAYQQAHREAARLVTEAEGWPYYKEHESEILQAMEADKRLSIDGAYRRIVLPKLRQLERQAVVNEMKAKPGASTHNPGTSSPTEKVPVSKLSWGDVFKREFAKRGGR